MRSGAADMAFGEPVNTYYDFAMPTWCCRWMPTSCARGPRRFATRRFHEPAAVRTTAANAAQAQMNRLYVVETAVTCTGAKADHRLALRASQIEGFARALAGQLGITDGGSRASCPECRGAGSTAVAHDLQQHRGSRSSSWAIGSRRSFICSRIR